MKLIRPNYNVTIKGRNYEIRPITELEINMTYVNWLNDPVTNKYLDVRYSEQTFSSIYDYVNTTRMKPGCEVFALFNQHNAQFIGTLGLSDFDITSSVVKYGIMIGDKLERMRGAGGEISLSFVDYLFFDKKVRKIFIIVLEPNTDALYLAESMGFIREGEFKNESVVSKGKKRYYNHIRLRLLRSEWMKRRGQFKTLLKYKYIIGDRDE